jgi:cell wall-associated NlpC family hydrolase
VSSPSIAPFDPVVLTSLIGVPYRELGRTRQGGLDCWGLTLLAGRELFDIEFPEFFYEEKEILAHACEHIRRETSGPRWREIGAPYPPGAIHIFRVRGFEVHCGIALDTDEFLHSMIGRNSCVERLRDANWAQRRVGSYVWTP